MRFKQNLTDILNIESKYLISLRLTVASDNVTAEHGIFISFLFIFL